MSIDYDFTSRQLKFLDLFQIAARFDCLYVLDFYCMDAFDHDNVSQLNEIELAQLADRAQRDIFAHAIGSGYKPKSPSIKVVYNGYLC